VSKNQNDISTDLRDLVSSLLVHEDDRPCPDEIVSHSFFKTKFIPDKLDSNCTAKKPHWSGIRPPSAETLQRGYSESWQKLCKESGVGIYAPGKVFPLGGSKRIVSVVKDCEKEIQAGRAPIVPLPLDLVYLPFPERVDLLEARVKNLSEIVEERESSAEGPQLAEISANSQSKIPSQVSKPHARRLKENVEPVEAIVQDIQASIKRKNSSRKKPDEPIAGPSRQTSGERTYKQRPVSSRQTSREQPVVEEQPMLARQPSRREKAVVARPPTVRARQASIREKQATLPRTMSAPTIEAPIRRSRTVRAVSASEEPEKKAAVEVIEIPDDTPPSASPVDTSTSFSDPILVLARAARLRDNIASALSGKNSVGRRAATASPNLPFVSKWVDYARKHGVGYVLEDGSIGCLFNASSRHPVTHVVVRHGYSHLQKVDKEMEGITEVPLEYYTHQPGDELKRTVIEGDRRRTTGVLWSKFGRYMCQALGQAEMQQAEETTQGSGDTLFVRYYQRLGTVGVWGFSNGCFQVSQIAKPEEERNTANRKQ
jgi:myosin-1